MEILMLISIWFAIAIIVLWLIDRYDKSDQPGN